MPEQDSDRDQAVPRGRPAAERRLLPQGLRRLRLGHAEPAGPDLPARERAHGHAGHRPRLLPGPTTGLERVDLDIVPLVPLRRRADAHPRHPAQRRPADHAAGARDPRQRRPEHPQGALQRAARDRHRRRRPPGRIGDGRPGLHRRRVRDPDRPQHDPSRRRGATATASRSSASPPSARSSSATPATSASPPGSAPSSAPRS